LEGSTKETLEAGLATLDAKLDATTATLSDAVKANDASCKADIEKLKAEFKEQQEEAEAAAAQEVEVAASWLFVTNPVHPTNRPEPDGIELIGKNFQQYDFYPAKAPFFRCTVLVFD
jgi:hypothetical protein